MGPETAIVIGGLAVLAAAVGAGGLIPSLLTWLRRDPPASAEPAVSAADEIRDSVSGLAVLASALGHERERTDELERRLGELELRIRLCRLAEGCPVRDQLAQEPTP